MSDHTVCRWTNVNCIQENLHLNKCQQTGGGVQSIISEQVKIFSKNVWLHFQQAFQPKKQREMLFLVSPKPHPCILSLNLHQCFSQSLALCFQYFNDTVLDSHKTWHLNMLSSLYILGRNVWQADEHEPTCTYIMSLGSHMNLLTETIPKLQCTLDISRLVGSKQWYRNISESEIYRATVMSQNQTPARYER